MPQPRGIAMALVAALLATTAYAAGAGVKPVLAGTDPNAVCSPTHLPTMWKDELRPPPSVRVLRAKGPNAGHVETVAMWKYVGVVLKSEYSTGSTTPYPWMQVGAITVKQYAWYYTMHWRGGRVSFTVTNPDGSTTTTTECYDVKDSTVDQLYRPEKPDPNNPGEWLPASQPTAANLKAMRETWHISLRKWQATKNKSRIILTGYRAGFKKPCGTDATGFRVYQKSLRDCGVKGLTLEETLREYFEPNLLPVDTRGHDIVDDAAWRGDLGLLVADGTDTRWRLYEGTSDGFNGGATGTFIGLNLESVIGYGIAQVDAADASGADDARLQADLVMLTSNDKVKVARSNGTGFESPTTTDAPAGAQRLVLGDFNGDRLDDVGVLTSPSAGNAKLWVMRRQSGAFDSPVEWWSGPLDVSDPGVFVGAGDVNGDEMADLVVRDTGGDYLAAVSDPSCADLSVWGACPASAIGPNGLNDLVTWLAAPSSVPAGATNLIGDYDRDGRDDVIAVANGSNFKVFGLRATANGGFADPLQLYNSSSAYAGVIPVAMDVNPDGMVDLALVTKDGTGTDVHWLRTIERGTNPASMTNAGGAALNGGVNWSADPRPF